MRERRSAPSPGACGSAGRLQLRFHRCIAVARRLRISRQIVHQWIRRVQQDAEWLSHQLGDTPHSGRPACKAALVDETIPGCLKSDPQARGYQVNGWTNGLLRQEVQRQHQVWVCPQTLRAGIQRAGYRWKPVVSLWRWLGG